MKFLRLLHLIVALLFLCVATGCDPSSGVIREVSVGSLPTRSSIEGALHAVPEITRFEYENTPPSTWWSFSKGTIHNPGYDQFPYYGPDGKAAGVVEVKEDAEGKKTLRLYYLTFQSSLPMKVIDPIRALMDKVYASIRKYDPQVPPPEQVHEKFIFIRG